jgi:hypothetical protein
MMKNALKLFVVVSMVASMAAAQQQQGDSDAASSALSGWYSGNATFYGGPQDSSVEEYDSKISTGSCGYGDIDGKTWPFYNVIGLAPSNPLLQGLAQRGCGTCVEVECVGDGCHQNAPPLEALITDECAAGCGDMQVLVLFLVWRARVFSAWVFACICMLKQNRRHRSCPNNTNPTQHKPNQRSICTCLALSSLRPPTADLSASATAASSARRSTP